VGRQLGDCRPFRRGEALQLDCIFYMPIPGKPSKKIRQRMIDGDILHTKKPDADNLVKWVKDCLNKVVWHDDNQIAFLTALKRFSDEPRTEIMVRKID